jgi:hypothetical protein
MASSILGVMRPGVLLVVLSTALPAAAQSDAPEPAEIEISEEARRYFETGVRFLEDPSGARYDQAYHAFKAAYAASPTPKILGNVGLCAMMLERDSEAIAAYRTYLDKVDDIPANERQQIERDLETLTTTATNLQLEVAPANAVIIDERSRPTGGGVVNRYETSEGVLAIAVRPGHHRFTIESAGFVSQTWELEAVAGTQVRHRIVLERTSAPKPARPRPRRPARSKDVSHEPAPPIGAYVTVAIAGTLAAGAIVTGIFALERRSRFDEINDGTDPDAAERVRDQQFALSVTTDVLIASAAVGTGIAIYLFVTHESEPRGSALLLRPTPFGIAVEGVF